MPDMPEGEEGVFGGQMPSSEGEYVLEMHGMAPIPLDNRYGRLHRIFTVWFTPVSYTHLTLPTNREV